MPHTPAHAAAPGAAAPGHTPDAPSVSAIGPFPGEPAGPFGDSFGDALDAAFGGAQGADTLEAVDTLPAEQPEPEAGLRTELALWALVFAGGIGSRFWPLSTPERPKPLLALVGERPLIAETVARLAPTVPPSRVLVLTSADIAQALHAAIPEVPIGNMLVEPRPMGTAASLAWGAQEVARRAGPKATLLATHADLAVGYPDELRRLLNRAAALAARGAGLVVLGAEPTRPEPGFGYVVPGEVVDAEGEALDPAGASPSAGTNGGSANGGSANGGSTNGGASNGGGTNGGANGGSHPEGGAAGVAPRDAGRVADPPEVRSEMLADPVVDALVDVPLDADDAEAGAGAGEPPPPPAPPAAAATRTAPRRVARFVEKPAPLLADELIAAGAFWHTGMLVARADAVLDALAERTPELQPGLSALAAGKFDRFAGMIQSVSIERGLLERSPDLVVLPASCDWDDVGTWASLRRVRELDDTGNGVWGRAHLVDTSSCVVHADGDGTVVVYGITGALVVSRPGLTFVTTLDRATELNPLLDALPAELQGGRRAAARAAEGRAPEGPPGGRLGPELGPGEADAGAGT
jgi:mannose-1-phosphate guanylyltransferase